jgi:GNAT superfamily N-acetyltransferase
VSEVDTDILVRAVTADAVRALRHAVLRAGRPESSARFAIDQQAETWHLAAYAGDRVVGVVTFFPDAYPGTPGQRAERFRSMAVDAEWRGRGVGTLLMREAARRLRERGVELTWAHGRDTALGFYEAMGFRVEGDGFIDPDTDIPHHNVVAEVSTLLE